MLDPCRLLTERWSAVVGLASASALPRLAFGISFDCRVSAQRRPLGAQLSDGQAHSMAHERGTRAVPRVPAPSCLGLHRHALSAAVVESPCSPADRRPPKTEWHARNKP